MHSLMKQRCQIAAQQRHFPLCLVACRVYVSWRLGKFLHIFHTCSLIFARFFLVIPCNLFGILNWMIKNREGQWKSDFAHFGQACAISLSKTIYSQKRINIPSRWLFFKGKYMDEACPNDLLPNSYIVWAWAYVRICGSFSLPHCRQAAWAIYWSWNLFGNYFCFH